MPTKHTSEKDGKRSTTDHPIERTQFTALLLSNPNYFGTIKGGPKPVKAMAGNTTYEEIKCVGYNPELNLLKAVVWVKLDSGYGGGLCSNGSREYVRFYISFDNGATWQDQGVVNFRTYDTPGMKPLEYAVTLQPLHYLTLCNRESLPKVRAILSWNTAPTTPNYSPVWGNVIEAHIQIPPGKFISLGDLLKEAKLNVPKESEFLVDPIQQVQLPTPASLGLDALAAVYKKKDVPDHRFFFPAVQKHLATPELTEAYNAYGSSGLFGKSQLDLATIIAAIDNTDGDITYEELTCVGLDPNYQENLVGILKVKRPNGYSGGQCTNGSEEYVAFWIDWEDGTGWHWAGTANVRVHDFTTIPKDGLAYAVAQPINLAAHRQPCNEGVVTAKVRAILSWSTPPPPWNPDYKPTWGNHLETRIHIYPGNKVQIGDYTPYLEGLCDVALCDIDRVTGFAPGDRPFGGTISIYGFIPGAPPRNAPLRPKYRISVSKFPGGAPQHLNDPFGVTLQVSTSGPPTNTSITQQVDASDFYTYQDAPPAPGIGWQTIFPAHLLARWNTPPKTGLYQITIEVMDPSTNTTFAAGSVLCAMNGSTPQDIVVCLDNAAPVTSLTITDVSHDGGATWQSADDCGSFQVGDLIRGKYSVTDEHFGSLSLVVQPSGHANGATPALSTASSYPAVPTGGISGIWTLNTAGMDPCGYTIQLQSNDRTIVSCDGPWRNDSAFVGFCLVAA
jgi:hypothetical protein